MRPRRFCFFALVLLQAHGIATAGPTCPRIEWPREALSYELEGATTLRFAVGQDGRAVGATVQRSSGWDVLDKASLAHLSRCVFPEPTGEGITMPTQFAWKLEGEPSLRPLLVPGSCAESERFLTFKNLDKSSSDSSGLVLRMHISSEGRPWKVAPEPSRNSPEIVDAAITYIQSCRCSVDAAVPGRRGNTTFGRLIFKSQ